MRILGISHLYPTVRSPRYGIFAARQMEEMARQGCEITLLVPRVYCPAFLRRFHRWRDMGHDVPLCQIGSLRAIPIVVPHPSGAWFNRWCGLVVYHRIRKLVRRIHRDTPFDLIYATDLFPDGDAAARLGAELSIPSACLAIGVDVNHTASSSRRMKRHYIRTVRSLDGTLACGQSVARKIDDVGGSKTLNVFGVVDLEHFSPADNKQTAKSLVGLDPETTIFSFAGYVSLRKGVFELIDAFRMIAETSDVPSQLVLCGTGHAEPELRRMVQHHNLDDRVHFLGDIHPQKVRDWLRASDVFVLPSHTEGMPNAVMEAMACGLPVISTRVGGLPDAVGDCRGVHLIAPKDVRQLSNEMLLLLHDPALRHRMGKDGRTYAIEKFDVARNVLRINEYLREVIAKWRRRNAESQGSFRDHH